MKTMVSIQNGAPKFASLAQLIITGLFAWVLVAFGQMPAAITSPANHASLSNPSVTFSWTLGVDAGIKRQRFRRFCSQEKQPSARTRYPLYSSF